MILPGILFTLATTLGVVSCARDVSGVPYANDSTVQTYLEARGRLIATEKEQRQGKRGPSCSGIPFVFECPNNFWV